MNSRLTPLLLHLVPADPEPLHAQISRQIRAKILAGDLATGEPPPSVCED